MTLVVRAEPHSREQARPVEATRLDTVDRMFSIAGAVLLAVGVLSMLVGAFTTITRPEPFDLNINLVAAQRLVDREPIYDGPASHDDAIELAGNQMVESYTIPTASNPSPPSTALLHTPFLVFEHGTGVNVFRVVSLLGMVVSVVLMATLLPDGLRRGAVLFSLGLLLASGALVRTLMLGQGHGFVMLAIAVGVWGVAKGHWRVAGIGLGLAAMLKISPVILIVYLVVRGRREIIASAAATMAVLVAAAALVGRPQDLITWITDVVPSMSEATARLLNQSVPALGARLVSSSNDLDRVTGIGAWRFLAMAIVLGGLIGLWRLRRGRPLDPLELGVLVLVVLVAGPLSWEHYATWAALVVVLVADPRRWAAPSPGACRVAAVVLGLTALMLFPIMRAPEPAAVAASSLMRLTTSPIAIALVLLLGVAVWLLRVGPLDAAVRPGQAAPTGRVQFPT